MKSGAVDGARTCHFIARGCFLCCFISFIAVVSVTKVMESYGGWHPVWHPGAKDSFPTAIVDNLEVFSRSWLGLQHL